MAWSGCPMDFGEVSPGKTFCLVGKMKVFDITHDRHRLVTEPLGSPFLFTGLLEFGHESYTLMDVELLQQFPVPHVIARPSTRIMHHDPPDWSSLHDLIDVCSGMGGMSQGAHAAGFMVRVPL